MAPKFELNEMVRLRVDPSKTGVVRETIQGEDNRFRYKVFFNSRDQRIVAEEDLLPLGNDVIDVAAFEMHRNIDDVRRQLLLTKLNTPFGESLFSIRASRIEFLPYQFKPVLKLIRNPDQHLLIADEVGLGKTIEAGIILTELQARTNINRVLVVCPAALRGKWRDELYTRFGERFDLLDAAPMRGFLDEYQKSGASTPLKGVASIQLLRRDEFLSQLVENRIHFDLVVIDEAHHCRNPGTRAHDLASILADTADATLLLTATPLHLGNEDLFHLLQILNPGEFDEFSVFEDRIAPNRYVNAAARLVQMGNSEAASSELRNVEMTRARGRFLGSPYYREVLRLLAKPTLDRADAVQVQRMLLDLNSLANVFTRTRKREVMEHAPLREAKVLRYQFATDEQAFYDATVRFVRQHWRWANEDSGSVGFALVMRERQAASSLPAFRDHFAEQMSSLFLTPEDLDMASGVMETNEDSTREAFPEQLKQAALALRSASQDLGHTDTKYSLFLRTLKSIMTDDPEAKIIVFSFFKKTLEYLADRLQQAGIDNSLIHGGVPVQSRQAIVEDFKSDAGIKVLLSSEVGSEGLDFQFCRILFNYDLPWNPMKVEQRIGRIDRFGQKSPKISIFSFVAEGTIEDRIYARLYERIRIFEQSIGDLEAILGEVMKDLSRQVYERELSPRQEAELAEVAANRIIQLQKEREEFEKHKLEFLGQDAIIQEEIVSEIESGRYVSPDEVKSLLATFVDSAFPASRLARNSGDDSWRLTPDEQMARHVRTTMLRSGQGDASGREFLERVREGELVPITYSDEIAYQRKLVEFITVRHPLFRVARSYWEEKEQSQPPVFVAHVELPSVPQSELFFYVFVLRVQGIRITERLVPVAVLGRGGLKVDKTMSDELFRIIQSASPSRKGYQADLDEGQYRQALTLADGFASKMRDEEQLRAEDLNNDLVNARLSAIEQTYIAKSNRVRRAREKVTETRIRRLRDSQLANLEATYEHDKAELEKKRQAAVTYALAFSGFMTINSVRTD